MIQQRTNHLSASSIAAFKACPRRWQLGYVEGLRKVEDSDTQRRGTNWHSLHEAFAKAFAEAWGHDEAQLDGPECEDIAFNAVIALLNDRYCNVPNGKSEEDWMLEREILHQSFLAYLWYWQNDPYEVIASEVPFELPLKNPLGTYLPAEEVVRVGKIDQIVKWRGSVCALERKSTSRAIDATSDYWQRLQKDTQVSMYALAMQDMGYECGNTLYDCWHVPTIAPKMLTQVDTAMFLDSHEYCGVQFDVNNFDDGWYVNNSRLVLEQGKRGFAIRETVAMFGARLQQDMQSRPEFYFARREIARTDTELEAFEKSLYAIYQTQKMMVRYNTFFENESACRATFACQYIPICFGCGADAVADGVTIPAGFKRIFTDLTIKGKDGTLDEVD